jgi:hypothetical protein
MFIAGAIPLSGVVYASASRLDGYLFWVPALVIGVVAVAIWAGYVWVGRRAAAEPRAESMTGVA